MPEYLVFARTDYNENVIHQGTVSADGEEDASAQARERFGEDWLEMTLVSADAMHWIVGPSDTQEQEQS